MLGRVVAAATSLADAAIVHLWVIESDGRTLRLAAELGERPGPGAVPLRPVLRMGEGLAGAVARSRRPIVVASLRGERRLVNRAWARDQGLVSFAGVPLASAERLLGVLCLFTTRRHRFTRHEVDLLRSFAGHAAVALENAALFDTATRRLRRLETLREIEGEISQQRDPEALLELIGRRATELLEADSATVFLLDEEAGLLRPHASYNPPEPLREVAIPVGEGVAGRVARDRQGMAVNDYPRSPYALDAFRDVERAVAGQPLLRGETVQGVILVRRSTADRPFTPEDLIQLGDFAVQASIALENARLLRLAAARAERVQAAAEVGRLLAATRHAERILDLIAEKCREILGAEAFGLFRLDPDGYLRYARGFGLDEAFMREHLLALGEGVVGKAAHERRLVETSDILRDPALDLSPAARARIEGVGSRALVAVPIVRRDEILGVLAVYHPPGFRIPPEEREFLQTLADHAAAALDTARLFDQARRRQRAAETLAEIGQSLTGSLDLSTVLSRVAEGVRRLLGSDGGSIGLVDADGAIRITAGVGLGAEAFRNVVIRPGQGTGGQVLLRGEPFWTAGYLNDPRISRDFAEAAAAAGLVAELAVPVRLGDETVGVLWASYERPVQVTDDDVGLATNLAQVVAVAVANARLYEGAQRAYQELQVTQDHLVQTEKLRALGEMASGVAHDFNNILAAILGRVQLMLTRVEDPTLRRWLEIVERAALDGAQTVRRIQEFTRVRRDQPTERVDLAQVLRDAVEMTRTRWRDEAQARGLEIRLVTEVEPVPPVEGQPAELRQALTNLIFNAIDALPQGGTITVGARLQDGAVEVSVADTGVGMPDAVRRRIFEPFFSTKGPKGSGLGLAMVYGIVSRHGGEVAVESREGAGSTFTIRLPPGRGASRPEAPAAAVVPEAAARVLVIDDEERVRDTLADMLRQAGHEVVVASQGAEGLERFRGDSFDLVVTDLAMPGMSGFQVARTVKALRPEVPVVLVTGWGVEVPAEQLRASGVDRVMTKPIRFDEVQEVVASLRGRTPRPSGKGVPR